MIRTARQANFSIALALSLGAFLLYLRTLAPGVLDGDSGEWQYMANILGVAHSTGYPLYLILAKAFTVLPIGSPAWRVNLFSAVCASLAVGVIFLLAGRLCHSRPAAAAAAALFAVAPTLWASAVEAEVYALNTLLLAVTLYFAVRWYQDRRAPDLCLTALAFGLALDNHRVSAFAAPGLLLLIWFGRKSLNARRLMLGAVLVLLPLLLYAYIPLRASQLLSEQSAANWQLYPRAEAYLKGTVSAYYNHTLYGFFNLVTGFDNRNKLGFQDSLAADSALTRLAASAALLLQQFNPLILVLSLGGIALFWKAERRLLVSLLAVAAGVAGISVTLRAESTRFYFSGSYLVLALFFSVGSAWLIRRLAARRWAPALAEAALVILVLVGLTINYAGVDASSRKEYDGYARTVLSDRLAANAVVVAPWEIVTGLRYFQLVEGQRADLLFVHESPVRTQFQKILASAHALKRPFYYVQFTPEDQRTGGTRTVQAVGLPLLTAPLPDYPLHEQLTDAVRVLGYDLTPDPAVTGQFVRLSVYYEVVAPVRQQFKAALDWNDIRGEPHGDWEHMPVSDYNATYLWRPGDYYRDVWDLPVASDAPEGLYTAQLSWYRFDPVANATDYEHPVSITLGPLRVGNFQAGSPRNPLLAEFSNGMSLLGYDLNAAALKRGQTLDVELYWSAARPVDAGYTVFVHLEDSNGLVRAQSDRAPWDGMYPTDRWLPGATVRDAYPIRIPDDLAGDFRIVVGLYRTPENPVRLMNGQNRLVLVPKLTIGE